MDRKTALKIMDKLTPLGINVVMVAVADPNYSTLNPDRKEGEPDYQIELSRNTALSGDRIKEMIDAVEKTGAVVEFPQMTVFTAAEDERRPGPPPAPVEPEPTEPTEPTEPPAPVESSPTTDDVVEAGHDDPRES